MYVESCFLFWSHDLSPIWYHVELYAVEYYKWYFLEFTQNFLLETIYNVNQHYKTLCTFLKAGYMFRWKKKLKIWILSSLLWEFYHSCHPEEWVQNLRSKSLQFHRHSLWAQAKERNYHLTENLPLFMLLASSQMLFSVALSFPYKSHFPHFFCHFYYPPLSLGKSSLQFRH